jgi:esterase/lipase superfamily enzyme
VIGLNEQNKTTNNANNPAEAIASDLSKKISENKNSEKIKSNKPAAVNSNSNDDSFDRIKNSMSADGDLRPAKQVERNYIVSGIISEKSRESTHVADNNNSGGVKVVGTIDPKILEDGKKKRQAILDFIAMMESEHKKIIKSKGGWNKDSAKLLRNKIAIEKARLKLF